MIRFKDIVVKFDFKSEKMLKLENNEMVHSVPVLLSLIYVCMYVCMFISPP